MACGVRHLPVAQAEGRRLEQGQALTSSLGVVAGVCIGKERLRKAADLEWLPRARSCLVGVATRAGAVHVCVACVVRAGRLWSLAGKLPVTRVFPLQASHSLMKAQPNRRHVELASRLPSEPVGLLAPKGSINLR